MSSAPPPASPTWSTARTNGSVNLSTTPDAVASVIEGAARTVTAVMECLTDKDLARLTSTLQTLCDECPQITGFLSAYGWVDGTFRSEAGPDLAALLNDFSTMRAELETLENLRNIVSKRRAKLELDMRRITAMHRSADRRRARSAAGTPQPPPKRRTTEIVQMEEIELCLQLVPTSEPGQPGRLVELLPDGVKIHEPTGGWHTPAVEGHQLPDVPGIQLERHAHTPFRSARWQAWYPKEHGQNTQTVTYYIVSYIYIYISTDIRNGQSWITSPCVRGYLISPRGTAAVLPHGVLRPRPPAPLKRRGPRQRGRLAAHLPRRGDRALRRLRACLSVRCIVARPGAVSARERWGYTDSSI